jgi:hypothetical protein
MPISKTNVYHCLQRCKVLHNGLITSGIASGEGAMLLCPCPPSSLFPPFYYRGHPTSFSAGGRHSNQSRNES